MRPESGEQIAPNWLQMGKMAIICWHGIIVNFFDVALFFLSNLVISPRFMSILLMVMQLWQFSFIGYCPEIWKLQIPLSKFCPISSYWVKIGIPNLAQTSLIKFYWMLQNVRITVFKVSELLRKNQQGVVKLLPPSRLWLK